MVLKVNIPCGVASGRGNGSWGFVCHVGGTCGMGEENECAQVCGALLRLLLTRVKRN